MSALWHTTNRFRYLYPTPVTGAMTCLRVLPGVRHGPQRLVSTRLWIDPQPRAARSWTDCFGNCVVEIEHPCLSSHLEVEAEFRTTSAAAEIAVADGEPPEAIAVQEVADAR